MVMCQRISTYLTNFGILRIEQHETEIPEKK